ncbi:hypothetical protein BJX64DRAFT_286871 [Aspergillus heterothallicus]
MPHLIYHKRRHSWPYCSSGVSTRERRNVPIITVTEPDDELQSQFLTPIISEDMFEDDAASAGIPQNKTLPHSNSPKMSRPSTAESNASFSRTSDDRLHRTESPLQMSSSRRNSPTLSNRRSGPYSSRKSSEDRRRYDNTVYHYGRHSNYWLFGGFSVRDTVRDGVDWIRQQKKG